MPISQVARSGNAAAPMEAPQSATASAKSARDLEGLATALVQIVACTGSVATAMMHQSRYQLPSSPVAVPISAKAPAVSKTPSRPTRRGPRRSTRAPTGMQNTALMNVAIVRRSAAIPPLRSLSNSWAMSSHPTDAPANVIINNGVY